LQDTHTDNRKSDIEHCNLNTLHACTTNRQILKFDPFPDDQKDIDEYRRRIRESFETANKLIADGVAKAKITGKFGVQVVIRPVKRRRLEPRSKQKRLDGF